MLPALNGLIKREEEMVWECFAETIEPIAIFIFPHTSQNELITVCLIVTELETMSSVVKPN